jgi:cardiolipin synthase
MAEQYERDLACATEIVLTARNRVRRAPEAQAAIEEPRRGPRRAMSGSAGRAAAGAVSVGSALGAALTNRRTLGPAEAGLLALMAVTAASIGIVAALWPRVVAWPLAFLTLWFAMAWGLKAYALHRDRRVHATGPERIAKVEDADG